MDTLLRCSLYVCSDQLEEPTKLDRACREWIPRVAHGKVASEPKMAMPAAAGSGPAAVATHDAHDP